MAIDQVGELYERIIQLDEKAKSLRRESNEIVAFVPGEDGQPKQIVTDAARFAEIGKELQSTANTRAATESKLEAITALLGHADDGDLASLDGSGYIDQATRLRFRFANELHPMMCNYRRALTLEEVQALPEYKALEEQTLPKIKELEAKAAADRALGDKVRAILRAA